MNVAEIKPYDIANGLGVRVSLFVSGCTHKCPGCFNSEAWDFNYGSLYTEETEAKLMDMLKPDYISGLSLLGGEPFDPHNQSVLADFTGKVKETYPDKNIWCYTGYLFDSILSGAVGDRNTAMRLLSHIDILVDGPFVMALKDITLKFRGSSNQRIIDVNKSLESGHTVFHELN